MNVLSLFDGMACGRIALERAGFEVENYYASEIDKHAMQVAKKNYPDIQHIGDVRNLTYFNGRLWRGRWVEGVDAVSLNIDNAELIYDGHIDLVIGGSPCQGFSASGKIEGFNDPRSKLFWHYVRLWRKIHAENPKAKFLLENVKMKKAWVQVITEALGVEPIEINSALVSAQNRRRLYWTNIEGVEQPEDKGIVLQDIAEDGMPLKACAIRGRYKRSGESYSRLELSDSNKSNALLAGGHQSRKAYTTVQCLELRDERKSNALTTVKKDSLVYYRNGASTIEGYVNHMQYKDAEFGVKYRNLTAIECERLQNLPELELDLIFSMCLEEAKSYVDAVEKNHKLLKLVSSAEKILSKECVKYVEESTPLKHQRTRCIVPQFAGMLTQRQTKRCTKANQIELDTDAKDAARGVKFRNQGTGEGFAPENAFISITEGLITMSGRVESHQRDSSYTIPMNGGRPLRLCGREIMGLVKGVSTGTLRSIEENFTYTTLLALSIRSIEQMLTTFYLFARDVITGYTQSEINSRSLSVKFRVNEGYTEGVSNTQRYKMLGNGWTVDVIAHIFKYMKDETKVNPADNQPTHSASGRMLPV